MRTWRPTRGTSSPRRATITAGTLVVSRTMTRPPSVDRLAKDLAATGLPHPLLVDAARRAIAAGAPDSAAAEAAAIARRMLQPVVNATGVLLHTNLGRAPLTVERPAGYTNLEL